MSRINQYTVATATFAVALGIGFVMQNGDALAARFSDTPRPAAPSPAAEPLPAVANTSSADLPAPRNGTAAALVRQRIEAGVTEAILAEAAARAPAALSPMPSMVVAAATGPEGAMDLGMVVPDAGSLALSVESGFGVDMALPDIEQAPILAAAADTDAVPPVAPPETMSVAPDCPITLTAAALPAALVDLVLAAPCAPSVRATIHHQGMMFTIVTDDAGNARLTVPALAEAAVFLAELGDAGGAVATVTVEDMGDFDRAVLQWQGAVGPEIHALEFGAGYGDPGHVWHGAPRAPDVALAGQGGFLMRLGDGLGLNPHMAEVYTFPTATTRQSGDVSFTVEAAVTEETCGRDLAAQTIQVSPGADPFAFDLTLAVPDCAFIGEILVMRDMILDLAVAAR